MKTLKVNLTGAELIALHNFTKRIEELEIREITKRLEIEKCINVDACNNALGVIYDSINEYSGDYFGQITFGLEDDEYNNFMEFINNLVPSDLKHINSEYNCNYDVEVLDDALSNIYITTREAENKEDKNAFDIMREKNTDSIDMEFLKSATISLIEKIVKEKKNLK